MQKMPSQRLYGYVGNLSPEPTDSEECFSDYGTTIPVSEALVPSSPEPEQLQDNEACLGEISPNNSESTDAPSTVLVTTAILPEPLKASLQRIIKSPEDPSLQDNVNDPYCTIAYECSTNKDAKKVETIIRKRKRVIAQCHSNAVGIVLISQTNSNFGLPLTVIKGSSNEEETLRKIIKHHEERIQEMVENVVTNSDFCQCITIIYIDMTFIAPNGSDPSPGVKMMKDFYEDCTSPSRMFLDKNYDIPNVEVINHSDGDSTNELQLRCQPRTQSHLQTIQEHYRSSRLQQHINDDFSSHKKVPGCKIQISKFQHKPCHINMKPSKLQTDGPCNTQNMPSFQIPNSIDNSRATVVINCITKYLEDPQCSESKMMRFLTNNRDAVRNARNREGYNVLHLMVLKERHSFFPCILYAGLWGVLSVQQVKPRAQTDTTGSMGSTAHTSFTPHRLSEAVSSRGKAAEIHAAYDDCEKIYYSMNKVSKLCLTGEVALIREYLKLEPSGIHQVDSDGMTPLMVACCSGRKDVVDFLLKEGADSKSLNSQHQNCLHLLCKYGHMDSIHLPEMKSLDIIDIHGYLPLAYAAKNGDTSVIEKRKNSLNIDETVLIAAVQKRHKKTVQLLVDEFQIDLNKGRDDENRSPLLIAIQEDDEELVSYLLNHFADLRAKDKYGRGVLHLAAKYSRKSIMSLLISKAEETGCLADMMNSHNIYTGQDDRVLVRGKDRSRRAWHWLEIHRSLLSSFNTTMNSGRIDVAGFGKILSCGFGFLPDQDSKEKMKNITDQRLQEGKEDTTPLHIAVLSEDADKVELLLKHGADPNIPDFHQLTSVHLCVMKGNLGLLETLVKYEGNIHPAGQGNSLVDLANKNGHKEMSNYLNSDGTLKLAKEFLTKCDSAKMLLTDGSLSTRRGQGQDMRRYLISTLRDLTIDINETLFKLGSGPVVEETLAT